MMVTDHEGNTAFLERKYSLTFAQACIKLPAPFRYDPKVVAEFLLHYGQNCFLIVSLRASLILVGQVLDAEDFNDSYLYDKSQAHIYRKIHHKGDGRA
ncbi:MAG: hypothetical protein KC467_08520 [Marinomonas atlantica]|nr:hypothetical protein [Marinomonas atlantica]